MEDVKLIYSVDKLSNLRSIVKQDLRDFGIKVPKLKKSKKLNQSRNVSHSQDSALPPNIFGNYLSMVPSTYISDCGFVPKFLVEAAEILEKNSDVEGIFRKSGSVTRQKELKQQIEEGGPLQSDTVHDVTGIVKQFFRELPEPLFTSVYHDTFVRCFHLEPPRQVKSILLLCLMLPLEHLSTLRYTMKLMSHLAARDAYNKMDVRNLAVVLAPNIMHVNSRSQKMNAAEEKLIQIQTAIVGLLIRNASGIGVVSESLCQRTALMTQCFGTEDELDASDDNMLEDSNSTKEVRKKARKRSNSLQGIVSTIGRGLNKLRRSTDGKNTSATTSGLDSQDSEMAQTSQSESLWVSQGPAELSLPPQDQVMATPVVMRKRRMSGDNMPFSATKRKAILDQLPQKSALGATPFTPASSKKRLHHSMRAGGPDTPLLPASDRAQPVPEATPKQDRSIRKKLNLFSPASNRKTKRCKSELSSSCGSGLRKSTRTKHLLRRLSGSKDREGDDEEEEDETMTPAGVPQSQSAMELSGSAEKTTPGTLTRPVSSPSVHNSSSSSNSPEHPNSLNRGFIDSDLAAGAERPSTTQAGVKDRGRTLRRADSFKPGQKPVRRSSSTDGAIRRGQPNKLSNGLLEGKADNVKKLRRSFDKSDISDPILLVSSMADKTYVVDPNTETASVSSAGRSSREIASVSSAGRSSREIASVSSAGRSSREIASVSSVGRSSREIASVSSVGRSSREIASVSSVGRSSRETASVSSARRTPSTDTAETCRSVAVTGERKPRASSSVSSESSVGEQSMMENSLLSVVLPPPSDFSDQSTMEVCDDKDNKMEGLGDKGEKMEESDNESEAGGFSTISGGTVIHKPAGHLHSLQVGKGVSSAIVHYGSSVSVTVPHPPPSSTLQTSVSADSLISTESETSEVGVVPKSGGLDRSASMDSGKGSLLDNAESRKPTSLKASDLTGARIQLEGRQSLSTENLSSRFNGVGAVKSLSAEDLKTARKAEKPAGRSQSMHLGSACHPPNIIPNLQISAETHRLLTRAGFLGSSLPPHVKDAAVPLRSPQKGDSTRQNFRRDQSHVCSFRLEKSATFRKERSSILYADHPAPVQERTDGDHAERVEHSQSKSADLEHEPMKEENAQAVVGGSEGKQNSHNEEVWVRMEPASTQRETGETVAKPSVSIKRAEVRMPKHDSVLHLQEGRSGRVAKTVNQFNSSLDQSLEQSNTSLHFHHCTTRTRGVSPVRIPTAFAKSGAKPDHSSAHYQDLAHKYHRRSGHQESESADRHRDQSLSEHRALHHSRTEDSCASERSNCSPKKAKTGLDLSSSLLETIEEVITPRRHKHPVAVPTDGSRSPLKEWTNTKTVVSQLRTTKGLTPHQVLRYGTKGAGTERSPGKPVKRLQSPARSPHSKHSPQKARESEAQRLESRHFHEQY
ncbi:hypothetical protein ACOMHN_026968 [Nucella lapillus]